MHLLISKGQIYRPVFWLGVSVSEDPLLLFYKNTMMPRSSRRALPLQLTAVNANNKLEMCSMKNMTRCFPIFPAPVDECVCWCGLWYHLSLIRIR